jgi:hypothetical protein
VFRRVVKLVSIICLLAAATPLLAGDEEFSLIGTYTENQPCKADDSKLPRVKITATQIDSVFGLCTILETKREGKTYQVHVECPGPGGSQMLGDVTFTLREDKTIDFSDQDQTYKVVLYKCP